MREHPLEHRFEAVLRHRLKRIGEIAVVAVRTDRNAPADARVEFARVDAPLLARVSGEEQLVEFAADARHDRVLRIADRIRPLAALVEERRHLRRVEIEAV